MPSKEDYMDTRQLNRQKDLVDRLLKRKQVLMGKPNKPWDSDIPLVKSATKR
jgi:hypothetical protein